MRGLFSLIYTLPAGEDSIQLEWIASGTTEGGFAEGMGNYTPPIDADYFESWVLRAPAPSGSTSGFAMVETTR